MAYRMTDSQYKLEHNFTSKPRNKKDVGKTWSDAQKMEAVKAYFILQNLSEASRQLGIPRDTLKTWTTKDWWKRQIAEFEQENRVKLTTRLKNLAERSLDLVEDRIKHGDWDWNPDTKELTRKPLKAMEAHKIANDTLKTVHERESLPIQQEASESTQDALKKLQAMFEKFAVQNKKAPVQVTDVIFKDE